MGLGKRGHREGKDGVIAHVKNCTDSVYFEVDSLLQRGVVANDERTKEPSSHDMVEEVVLAVLPGHVLGGAYA